MNVKLGEQVIEDLRQADPRDMSLIIPISRVAMAKPVNWLDNKEAIAKKFEKAAKESTGLPSLKFEKHVPVFLKTVGKSRMTKSQYGEREIVTVEILEPKTMKENPPGTRMTLWVTQEVFRTKIEPFRGPDGWIPAEVELCIVNTGEEQGKRFNYQNYWIGTAEQGLKILEGND